jgi:hypothetical protein
MENSADLFESYYTEKLWGLIPLIYRTEDTIEIGSHGPLRQIVERIGRQAAVVRRSIDRLWEDQSIESCDDWVIPYIAELLGTRLVSTRDPRGMRIDVAKTMYYRRRTGKVATIQEVAADITGWQVVVVEFFKRIARAQHGLDPKLGRDASGADAVAARNLLLAEGRFGSLTGTPMGGWADLRKAYAGSRNQTAFDEFAHTVDMRGGVGQTGWQNIDRLGVFVWRLKSFGVDESTPVESRKRDILTFDPTGRQIPLFSAGSCRTGNTPEWACRGPIDRKLLTAELEHLYAELDAGTGDVPLVTYQAYTQSSATGGAEKKKESPATVASNSLALIGATGDPVHVDKIAASSRPREAEYEIDPETGTVKPRKNAKTKGLVVKYHYGFSSEIGAGPYDRRVPGTPVAPDPDPTAIQTLAGAMPNALPTAIDHIGPVAVIEFKDSLTYADIRNVVIGATVNNGAQLPNGGRGVGQLTIRGLNRKRPVIRPAKDVENWIFEGIVNSDATEAVSELTLEGLLISGVDIVLRGRFNLVRVNCCTFDPGTLHEQDRWETAVDGRELRPSSLKVEGEVRRLTITRSILGPIQANNEIEVLTLSDSIVQAPGGGTAIHVGRGESRLRCCTILGKARFHRLVADECIFNDLIECADQQHGGVAFSALPGEGSPPQRHECVAIDRQSPLFVSRRFGQPGYGQLISGVDPKVITGGRDGSEMGAFNRELNPVKERGLRAKLQEYMPIHLIPVIVNVT